MLYWLRERLISGAGWGWLDGPPFSLFEQIEFRAALGAIVSFLIVVLLGRRVIETLRRLKIGDTGLTDAAALQSHAQSKKNVPTMGGVLICGATLLSFGAIADITQDLVKIGLVVLLWLSFLGGVDDFLKLTAARRDGGRQGLYAWEKLVFQLGLGLLVGWFGYDAVASLTPPPAEGAGVIGHVVNLPFQRTYTPGGGGIEPGLLFLPRWAYVLVAVLFLTGMSNAVNITDGMDGLAGGVAASVLFGLLLLALIANNAEYARDLLVPHVPTAGELAVLSGSLAGACLGFLWWNSNPAQVFMGDTGSLAIGGVIAFVAIAIRQEVVTLLMCGVFLLEIASVVLQVGSYKLRGGRRVFRCAPYHHHLQMGGWPENRIVSRFWIVTVLLTILAVVSVKVR
ncbi:MAG: phospho-N-acetylmuramoyl-pentapeptide-transferase [Planctomycetota bacterium]